MPPLKGQLLAKRLGGPEDPALPGVNGLMLSPEHGPGVLGEEPGHLCSGGTWGLRAETVNHAGGKCLNIITAHMVILSISHGCSLCPFNLPLNSKSNNSPFQGSVMALPPHKHLSSTRLEPRHWVTMGLKETSATLCPTQTRQGAPTGCCSTNTQATVDSAPPPGQSLAGPG